VNSKRVGCNAFFPLLIRFHYYRLDNLPLGAVERLAIRPYKVGKVSKGKETGNLRRNEKQTA
jgi:hypothetical protein